MFAVVIALNGYSQRQAIPIFAAFAVLFALGTALLVAVLNVVVLGRTAAGARRWGASALLGAGAGMLQLVPSLVFLAMF